MAVEAGREWVGTPLETDEVDPRGTEEIVVQYDRGEEILVPRLSELFGSYDPYEAANYIHYLSGHILKEREGEAELDAPGQSNRSKRRR